MDDRSVFRLFFRIAAVGLAVCALFGWNWFAQYRTNLIDELELPILSFLLIISALLPARILLLQSMKPVIFILLVIDVSTFIWWFIERAHMTYGGYDIGGIGLRLFAYAIVFSLVLPSRKKDMGTKQ